MNELQNLAARYFSIVLSCRNGELYLDSPFSTISKVKYGVNGPFKYPSAVQEDCLCSG